MHEIRKAVVPAAGLGTRQYPATAAVRKEFFPLVDRDGVTKPAIQIAVEEALAAGVEQVCIVCDEQTERACRRHFRAIPQELLPRYRDKPAALEQSRRLAEMGQRLAYARQPERSGLGHAVWCARDVVGDEPFLVLLPDHVYLSIGPERCAARLARAFQGRSVTALIEVGEDGLTGYGIARGRFEDGSRTLLRVEGFLEKPDAGTARARCRVEGLREGRYLAHFGMHVFTPGILDALDEMIQSERRERGEFQLTAAQDELCRREPYSGLVMDGLRYDIGTPAGLLAAQVALAAAGPMRRLARWTSDEAWERLGRPHRRD